MSALLKCTALRLHFWLQPHDLRVIHKCYASMLVRVAMAGVEEQVVGARQMGVQRAAPTPKPRTRCMCCPLRVLHLIFSTCTCGARLLYGRLSRLWLVCRALHILLSSLRVFWGSLSNTEFFARLYTEGLFVFTTLLLLNVLFTLVICFCCVRALVCTFISRYAHVGLLLMLSHTVRTHSSRID